MIKRLKRSSDFGIWTFALGYFAFYIPYVTLIKLLMGGSFGGTGNADIGVRLLPSTLIGTAITVPLLIAALGGWKYVRWQTVGKFRLPVPGLWPAISGCGTALIIATTTLAYTFAGISIVFALLLMRGGVLVMAPLIDHLFGRRVHGYSWFAFALSLTAVIVAIADTGNYVLSGLAIVNLCGYLCGYVARLQSMTHRAKTPDRHANYRFFVQEQMVTVPLLIVVPIILAIVGVQELRMGFTTFLVGDLGPVALLIGVFYACLLVCGSMIYLDARENTFCIPVNRCSSLLAGLVASFGLTLFFDFKPVSLSQLFGSVMIMGAIGALALLPLYRRRSLRSALASLLERPILFVCGGNTIRSPMARALCENVLTKYHRTGSLPIQSAGLTAHQGAPMSAKAASALAHLGVAHDVGKHRAQQVTEQLVERAQHIFCMTQQQCDELTRRYPQANGKVQLLNGDRDIEEPQGEDPNDLIRYARRIQQYVYRRLEHLAGLRADAIVAGG